MTGVCIAVVVVVFTLVVVIFLAIAVAHSVCGCVCVCGGGGGGGACGCVYVGVCLCLWVGACVEEGGGRYFNISLSRIPSSILPFRLVFFICIISRSVKNETDTMAWLLQKKKKKYVEGVDKERQESA